MPTGTFTLQWAELRSCGSEYMGYPHGFALFPKVYETADTAITQQFLSAILFTFITSAYSSCQRKKSRM